jgi:hypothetical protein
MIARSLVLAAAVLAAALAACNSSKHDTAPAVDAYQSGSGATCATLTSGISDFRPGVDGTPSGFPSAPAGLVLCGTDPMTGTGTASVQVWYLAGSLTQDAVFSYYQTQLAGDGYTVSSPVAEPGGNTKVVFSMGSASAGSIVYNSTELFVLLTYPS